MNLLHLQGLHVKVFRARVRSRPDVDNARQKRRLLSSVTEIDGIEVRDV